MRRQKEVSEEVLARAGRYHIVYPKGHSMRDPAPLKVKEVWVEDSRYVVCLNEDQVTKDAADREAIVAALREQLKRGDKSLIGNRGYRKYLQSQGKRFTIDEKKLLKEARYDGKWVLRTNTDLPAAEIALKYKQLWMVEEIFRSAKSWLQTRPIFHKCDETIRGHVFCSFLALVLRKELQDRLDTYGHRFEWAEIITDLEALQEVEVQHQNQRFLLPSEARGTGGKVFQAVGVALPATVRQIHEAASS
jgi:Transposase DDE domain